PVVYGTTVRLYDWPIRAGQTWTTPFMPGDVFRFGLVNATLRTEAFEEGGPRLRIQGETTDGTSIDYDYDPETGWMTYFRMINQTTGRVVASLDVLEAGSEFHGEIHALEVTTLYEGFALMPPFDPSLLPQPAAVEVPSGFQWIEYIRFVGVYSFEAVESTPLPVPVGAGVAAVTILQPDAKVSPLVTEGALEFHGEFRRDHLEPYAPGTYVVTYALAGTAFGFCLITGFKERLIAM
ncbi:MAG: hypothetical protein ACREA0_33870, partial [bacterium]